MNDKITRFIFAVLILWSVSVHAEDLSQQKTKQIEQIVSQAIQKHGIPGLSVAVATNNELKFSKGFGQADLENSVPATRDTRYRTASIAKSMTAVAVMSLVEGGAIDLGTDVREYCSAYPEKRWTLTTRQLLGHLGGVRHYKNRPEAQSTRHFYSLRSALGTFRKDPLLHEPGTKFLYTTFGYNLLGSIVEGAQNDDFPTVLRQRVFSPTGMTLTCMDNQHEVISGRASGYIRPTKKQLSILPADHRLIAGEVYNCSLHDTSMKIPGGGLLSTAPDLVKFAIAVNTNKLLTEKSVQQMWTSQKTADGKTTGYGLGWKIGSKPNLRQVWHTGGQAGTSTILYLEPETGTAVAIMCNLQHTPLFNLATSIAKAVQNTPSKTNYTAAIKRLQKAIRYEVEQKQLPAFSISIVDGDRTVWADGFGFQDAKKKIPATAETVYRVGSVSKLFTDIAVMQLVENNKLDLDAPIQKSLPEFKPTNPYDVPITLRQLMTHRSGLVRESPVGNYFDPTEPTLAATVASLNQTSLVYKPDTKTKYSNAAVSVVGTLLEQKLKGSHAEQVRKSILDPLDMNSSSFVVTPKVKQQLATGWMRTYDGRRFEAPTFLLGTGPAGNMYSNVLDLSGFLTCIFNEGQTPAGQILNPETFRQMTSPQLDSDGKPQRFGIGFHIQDFDGNKKIGHGGAVYGFSTQLAALPERNLGVAAVSSLDGSNGVVRRLSDYALRLMIASQDGDALPSYRTTGPVPTQRAKELVGMYREVDGSRFTRITELNGTLYMQRGSSRFELRATADNGTIVTDDAVGFGTEVKLKETDRLLVGETEYQRLPSTPPAAVPARWKGLIGEYGWDHNTLYILEEDGQLYVLIEWFYYYPLKEIDQDTFAFPDYGLYHGEGLKFTRDAQGTGTKVVAAEVKFDRREVGTKDGETFRIQPVKPIDDLRAAALSASPPPEPGDYRKLELVDLAALDSKIQLDIRYASTNNFTGSKFYQQSRAFMQEPAAKAVVKSHKRLEKLGLGLLIHDAYRPWHVTKMFWDATPGDLKDFVANPANGSRHNRGCAIDLTLYDLKSGNPIQMVAGYDEFSPRSFPLYPGGTSRQRWYRQLLRETMEAEGFTVYEYEWWHFDYKDWKKYRIGNLTFEEIDELD